MTQAIDMAAALTGNHNVALLRATAIMVTVADIFVTFDALASVAIVFARALHVYDVRQPAAANFLAEKLQLTV